MNCLIYLRVSTKEQAEGGYSIQAQREACAKYIQDKGWNLIDEYADRGESAKTADRPQLQEMLQKIKEDKSIGAVLVHKIDRLSRNIEDHGALRAIFRKNNIQLVSVTENIEDTASGKLVEGILATIAEFYSLNLSSEIKKGMNQKVKQGGWPHTAPIGYKNVRDDRGISNVVINNEEADLVREAFELYATGDYSINEIHQIMEKKGLKNRYTNKPLSRSKIAEVLKNRFFIGYINWKGIEYSGIHDPLISKELFFRVQEVFKVHDKAGERTRKHRHFLKGTLFCAECGSRLGTQLKVKPNGRKYNYFFCLGKARRNGCKQEYILDKIAEKAVENLYRNIQFSDEIVKNLKTDLDHKLVEQEAFNIKKEKYLTKKISQLSEQKYKLMQAYYSNAISIDILKHEQDRIIKEMDLYKQQLETTNSKLDRFREAMNLALDMASSCYFLYTKINPEDKRKLNQAFFNKVFIRNKKLKGVQYSELLDFIFELKSSIKNRMVEVRGFEPLTSAMRTQRSCD